MLSLRLRPTSLIPTFALAAAAGLLAGCESSGSPDVQADRSSTLIRTDQPPDAGSAAELRLLSQTAAAPTLTREHLLGSVIAWRDAGRGLEGGFSAWATQARAGRWVPEALLVEPNKPVRAGEAAQALALLLGTSDPAAGARIGPTGEADAIAALREAGVIARPVATGDPISGERWLAWLSAASDLQPTLTTPAPSASATAARSAPTKPSTSAEPRTSPSATASAADPPKGESFDEFDSTPATTPPPPPPPPPRTPPGRRAATEQAEPPIVTPGPRQPARTQTADQPTIPSARPEPLPARLDEVAETASRRPGSPAAPADRRRAWTPGRPVQPNQPAKPADANQGAPR